MNWQALWFVLAGLILGFALSTLWEWLYFRRARLTLNDERVAELEEQLRLTEQYAREDHAGGYQSPGVLLESEEAEELSDMVEPSVEAESAMSPSLPYVEEESAVPIDIDDEAAAANHGSADDEMSDPTAAFSTAVANAHNVPEEATGADEILTLDDEDTAATDEVAAGEPVNLAAGSIAGAALSANDLPEDAVEDNESPVADDDDGSHTDVA